VRAASTRSLATPGRVPGATGANSEALPDFTDCFTHVADVSWLSENPSSLPLARPIVTVTLDASVPDVIQPGTYTAAAAVAFGANAPYPVASVPVR
jgi:hypothetical protein